MTSYIQPLAYSPPYVWSFWVIFLLAYVPEFLVIARATPARGDKTDRGSMTLIIIASWLAFPAAFAVAPWSRFALPTHRIVWFALGLATLLTGSALRHYCFRTLGRYFTGNVKVQANQPVIEHGPYRFVRHPSYTGGMLMFLGTGLALTNWLSALILVAMGLSPIRIACAWRRTLSETRSERHMWNTCGARSALFRSYSERQERTQ